MNLFSASQPDRQPGEGRDTDPATTTQDQDLLSQARDHITEAFGGTFPDGLSLSAEDRRIRLNGRVATVEMAERIAKAAAIGPGVLGVHNDLEIEQAPPDSGASSIDADAAGHGEPLPPPTGQIHHKV